MRVWREDWGSESDADEIDAFDAQIAAELFAEYHHADMDYPETIDVCVRDGDEVRVFEVVAEQTMSFDAREVEP